MFMILESLNWNMAVFASVSWYWRKGFCASEEETVKCFILSDREREFVPIQAHTLPELIKTKSKKNIHFFNTIFSCIWFCSLKLSLPKNFIFWLTVCAGIMHWPKARQSAWSIFAFFLVFSEVLLGRKSFSLRVPLICKSHRIHTSRSTTSLFSDKWSFEENQLLCQQIRL